MASTLQRLEKRIDICRFAIDWLYALTSTNSNDNKEGAVQFSIIELLNAIKNQNQGLFSDFSTICLEEVEEALLYLSQIGALKLEGGFLVLYNAMDIQRLKDNRQRYKQEEYRMLNEFYKQKMQQIHIVGEYANLMVKDLPAALQYVQDYFLMDYQQFIAKYFKGERVKEIERNVTPAKYKQIYGELSDCQKEILKDKESHCIIVAAGPGSGKTRVLVHKLASLLLLEDVKHEQLLMLTFSRSAATEFKTRLKELVGDAVNYVEIKTFHSYCFDLLGRVGNLEDAVGVVKKAAAMILSDEVEPNRISKSVLVIDEAQDMSADEFALVSALMEKNEEMRVIAVGDDDQNIYGFRGSNSKYLQDLLQMPGSRFIEMTENYRSDKHIVDAANQFATAITQRMKHQPIVSMSKENGIVRVINHPALCAIENHRINFMYQPIVEEIISSHLKDTTTCVLTQTNEEALNILALLHRNGIKAKLVQSLDGLRFWNMAETRYFMKQIEQATSDIKSPIIPEECWKNAKDKTYIKYEQSQSLEYLQRCLQVFEQNNQAKYETDIKEFFFESSVEDFCDVSKAEVVVSTIHKSKGREFDNVFLLIDDSKNPTDEVLRSYYVAITRAKHQLTIHTQGKKFDRIQADQKWYDPKEYDMPKEIILQLTHKDIYLNFSKPYKHEILSLKSGDSLGYHDYRLCIPSKGRDIAMLSSAKQNELKTWAAKGYKVTDAKVRFIVAWKPKDAPKDEKEYAIPLIDLTMKRKS